MAIKKMFFLIIYFTFPIFLFAQWKTQTINLHPGWNSIYLEVDPFPNKCVTIFENVSIESVWAWSAQFEVDSLTEEWLIYNPLISEPELTTLHTLQGGKAYRIHYSGEEPRELNIQGRPVLPKIKWESDTFTIAGFHVSKNTPPTFKTFFASAAELAGNEVFKMDAEGNWNLISDLDNETINKGEAYWVRSNGYSTFSAPFELELEQNNSLEFGQALVDQVIRLKNNSDKDKELTITTQNSEENQLAAIGLAGAVKMDYWNAENKEWVGLGNGLNLTVPANESTTLRIGVDRTVMPSSNNNLYQSLINIIDLEGTELTIPVSARGLSSRAGLWVGSANINKVSYINGLDDTPQSTPSEFSVRLLIHVDAFGKVKLLDEVIQMWKDGTYKADPNDASKRIVDEPGSYVLITDNSLIDQYAGAALRDGKLAGRRISSPFFSFDEPQLLKGAFEDKLSLENYVLDFDDPLNPFKHAFHPDHNNMDERNENKLPEGRESYTVTRSIDLLFTVDDPDNLNIAGWRDNQLGGIYQETIKGIHKQDLKVGGTFRLQRISNILTLDDAPTLESPEEDEDKENSILISEKDTEKEREKRFPTEGSLDKAFISPNPVRNELRINGLERGNYKIIIRSIDGKASTINSYQAGDSIDTNNLPSGVFNLEIWQGTSLKSLRFIKQSN